MCFVTFPYGVLGQVLYLVVSIPELCQQPIIALYFELENGLKFFITSGPGSPDRIVWVRAWARHRDTTRPPPRCTYAVHKVPYYFTKTKNEKKIGKEKEKVRGLLNLPKFELHLATEYTLAHPMK